MTGDEAASSSSSSSSYTLDTTPAPGGSAVYRGYTRENAAINSSRLFDFAVKALIPYVKLGQPHHPRSGMSLLIAFLVVIASIRCCLCCRYTP